MHFLVLINTCSHTYTCLPASSHADAHPGEEQIQGECLPSSLQMHPARKASLTWRRGVVCRSSLCQGHKFLDRVGRGSPQPFAVQKTPRVVNGPPFWK